MRRLLVFALLLALVGAGAALAARGDPQKEINPADQARAKAMLLKKADLGPGFQASPPGGGAGFPDCKAFDQSDLTLTGDAETPDFSHSSALVQSSAEVFESVADANASWRRRRTASADKCAREALRRALEKAGVRLVSYRRVPFPRLAPRTVAYRLVASEASGRIYGDIIFQQQSRALTVVSFVSTGGRYEMSEQVRLARLTANRMAKAMRGA